MCSRKTGVQCALLKFLINKNIILEEDLESTEEEINIDEYNDVEYDYEEVNDGDQEKEDIIDEG